MLGTLTPKHDCYRCCLPMATVMAKTAVPRPSVAMSWWDDLLSESPADS